LEISLAAATRPTLCRYSNVMQAALQAIKKILAAPAPDVPGADGKAAFADRFERELARFERMDRDPEAWEAESLLSALGAAAVEEFELACAFVDTVRSPRATTARRNARGPTYSIAALRRRFERMCA
jgi:hypothetical protein